MTRQLPAGTVTFLFTDVEGSTKLLHELGESAYADALADHRRTLREAIAAHGGTEVDTQGDAFFAAFPTASNALAAAGNARDALAQGPIRVRMGLHTGAPHVTSEGYIGVDVHRAARIAAVGHGGQVLLSASTAALVDAELRDLGDHRLKDLSAPERLYQLGGVDFPPLKSLYRTNLPVPATPFVRLSAVDDARRLGSGDGRWRDQASLGCPVGRCRKHRDRLDPHDRCSCGRGWAAVLARAGRLLRHGDKARAAIHNSTRSHRRAEDDERSGRRYTPIASD